MSFILSNSDHSFLTNRDRAVSRREDAKYAKKENRAIAQISSKSDTVTIWW
ncbi:hypothetical protein [Nostoc favosum]|uniref:Uncharacterized protein n=1 Tax=Nostoc favosum CHAB5714 TaxID=2780399 RepID=A0ABS8I2T3_9NOSO|nr:hypothetical protein [Nostoc favosum]MCC5598505.1 hypothetical protein [Nostoc favosum CHAB5714]